MARLLPYPHCDYNLSLLRLEAMESNNEGATHGIYQRRHNGQSLDEYRHHKLLPHINEEYEFRITNKLLVQKIANPRRDRIIIDSLAHTSYSQFYKSKKASTPHQETSKYRRKIVLTADRKKRQKPQNCHDCEKMKREQMHERTIAAKRPQEGGNKNYEEEKQNDHRMEQQKSDEFTMSRTYFEGRDNYVGKIVRNNSNYVMRIPKKGILKSNYFFNSTYVQESHKKIPKDPPQQMIKRIVRRIYQDDSIEKEGFN